MLRTFAAVCALAMAGQAFAGPVYNFTDNNANTGPGHRADLLDSLSVTWDAGNNKLDFSSKFSNKPVNSFWLVINDGPNPKGSDENELVIMYGDLDKGIVTSYAYNGLNSANSYAVADRYLQTDVMNVNGNMIDFSIDANVINSQATTDRINALNPNNEKSYRGIVAGPGFGIWYHVAYNSLLTYDDKLIDSYRVGTQGWYDRGGLTMERVPEPGSLALLGLGLLGLGALRRRQR